MALHPRYFTKDVKQRILKELRNKVEGKCTGRFGYTILVKQLFEVGAGKLDEGTGWAHFPVKYLALVFRPFKNEVLPAEVIAVNETGVFAQVGPMVIFVSQHNMASDIKYDPQSDPPCFVSEEQSIRMVKGSNIVVRIVGIRFAATEITVVGSIHGDFLGPVEE